MFHQIKHKFDLYYHSGISTATEIMNSPKTGGVLGSSLVGFGLTDINNALETVSVLVGLVVGGVSLWIMIEKRISDRKKRKVENEIDRLKVQELKLKNNSLENHIKKQNGKG